LPFLGAVSPSDFLNDVVSLYTFDVFLDDWLACITLDLTLQPFNNSLVILPQVCLKQNKFTFYARKFYLEKMEWRQQMSFIDDTTILKAGISMWWLLKTMPGQKDIRCCIASLNENHFCSFLLGSYAQIQWYRGGKHSGTNRILAKGNSHKTRSVELINYQITMVAFIINNHWEIRHTRGQTWNIAYPCFVTGNARTQLQEIRFELLHTPVL
jgi:hypothetical protein